MSDELQPISSMIKSRRDERYFGSSFEKRDPRLDTTRHYAADARFDGDVANDGVLSPDGYAAASWEAGRTGGLANDYGNRESTWDPSRLRAHERDPASDDEYLGERLRSRNVGIPAKQPALDEIKGGAQQYANRLANEMDDISPDDLYTVNDPSRYYQMLLDRGYSEEDIQKFKEVYTFLHDAKVGTQLHAKDNAKRIRNMRQGESDE